MCREFKSLSGHIFFTAASLLHNTQEQIEVFLPHWVRFAYTLYSVARPLARQYLEIGSGAVAQATDFPPEGEKSQRVRDGTNRNGDALASIIVLVV